MIDPHNERMVLEMLLPLKEHAREKARAWAQEPLGRFVKVAGQRVILCKAEGRSFTIHDLKAVVDEAVAVENTEKGAAK